MSSEPLPGRRNSFEDSISQERRQEETSDNVDDDSESDDDDAFESSVPLPPSDVGKDSVPELNTNPIDKTAWTDGRVLVNGQSVTFQYEIGQGASYAEAKWVVIRSEGNPPEVLRLLPPPTNDSSYSTPGRDLYTVKTNLVVENGEHFWNKMFIVLDKSDEFGSYALGAFGMVSSSGEKGAFNDQLSNQMSSPDDKGGFTNTDSLWYLPGMTTEPSDGDGSDTKGSDSETSGDDGEENASRGPLSIGAKAGIGVGAGIAGLIIIGLAIFFFLRRRRRKRAAATDKSLTPANDYMGDKEAHAAQIAETPHSPASDDDNRPRDSAFVATGDAAPPADRSSAVATPTSEQRQVPHSVAHLVEEGMTEEQIRRLEEEERALDQAIERAARK